MKTILITGSDGFIGKNLTHALQRFNKFIISTYEYYDTRESLHERIQNADLIIHLAGTNRSEKQDDFIKNNVTLLEEIITLISLENRKIPIIFTSSIQAVNQSIYGVTKKQSEDLLIQYSKKNRCPICILRLPNMFGKWSKPNYNSVVATFCYNVSHNLEITINDVDKQLELMYIDDLIMRIIELIESELDITKYYYNVDPVYTIKLGDLAETITTFKWNRDVGIVPNSSNNLTRHLYSTYLSFIDPKSVIYGPEMKHDNRGFLVELIKSNNFGQIFVSQTKPGVIRGNHYHDSKVEKFCILKGHGLIKLRQIHRDDVYKFDVDGSKIKIIDIPPGYTHSIENIGDDDMIVLFWANEMFDKDQPDTYFEEV